MIVLLALIAAPLVLFAIDIFAAVRVQALPRTPTYPPSEDNYTILVPIYGNIAYLENTDYLSQYGERVVLLTTGGETSEFMTALYSIAQELGFRVYVADWTAKQDPAKRSTSGSIRDRLIRDALHEVETEYVVPLDADSTTRAHFSLAVGQLAGERADIASVRLELSNPAENWLTQLQRFEYRIAMELRKLAPWLISGACQVARTSALLSIMQSHSLFFQGNDVEIGLLAKRMGYKVVHLPFVVFTAVPSALGAWIRQRLAWAGGEFRLYVVNVRYVRWHPFFWIYGCVIVILALPLRYVALASGSISVAIVIGLYFAFVLVMHWRNRNGWLAAVPLYSLVNSLVMVPFGPIWYVKMAVTGRNAGLIRPRSRPGRPARNASGQPLPSAPQGTQQPRIHHPRSTVATLPEGADGG